MSAEPTRPRPRPRPRPKAQASSPGPSSAAGATSSSPVAASKPTIEEEDAMFMRKRRTAEQWKELAKIERQNKPPPPTIDISDEDESPRARKIQKKSKTGAKVPSWANRDITSLLTSEDDSDDTSKSTENTPIANRKQSDKSAAKRKRERSRSRSITPPPALPIHHIQQARNLVRQTLESAPRAASPTYLAADDSMDNITLDPELAMIAKTIRNAPHAGTSGTSSTNIGGGPEVVTVKVKWQPHPLDDSARPKTYGFQLKRHDNFRDLFAELADDAGVLVQSVVVSYDGKRVFSSATPHSILIWAEAELEACDKTTYEYIRIHKHQRSPSPIPFNTIPNSREGTQEISDAEASESEETQKIKLTLRSSMTTKDISLTVRPTTTCGAVAKAFLKAAGLSDQYPGVNGATPKKGKRTDKDPRLSVEGEKMDPSTQISETELEDGDMVEVVGL